MSAPVDDRPLAFRVVRGGVPSDEELAAVVVALTPVAAASVPTAEDEERVTSAWQRAALLEGVGAQRVSSPGQLTPTSLGRG